MSNQINETEVSRDTTMDLSSLLKQNKSVEEKPTKSPLEMMKEEQEKNGLGLVVEKKDLTDDSNKHLIANKAEDEAMDEIEKYNTDMDKMIDVAKNVKLSKKPNSAVEMAQLIDELSTAADNGGVINNEHDTETNSTKKTNSNEENEITKESKVEKDDSEEDLKKREIVNIIIDKTGYGANFDLTEEEKEKIYSSSEIRVKEVEEVDLSSITVKKAEKSFLDTVTEFESNSASVPVVFPASRFRAYMTGLSYGEMGDIALNSENVTEDQINKKLSVIYNKMRNPSIGKFDSYEDFLRNFAYVDIDLALYGLVVATFPEVDEINMTCNAENCKKGFNHRFSPRSLIQWDKSDTHCLNAIKDAATCSIPEAKKLLDESPIHVHKRYRLPYSGFIVEVGVASCYDYLYSILPNIIGDNFQKNHPDDVNNILQINNILLSLIRAVYVPNGNNYIEYTDTEDMIQALYHIKPEEIAILTNMLQKYNNSYSVSFGITNVVCPHCGTVTKMVDVDISDMLFFKQQKLLSTEIDVNSISVL